MILMHSVQNPLWIQGKAVALCLVSYPAKDGTETKQVDLRYHYFIATLTRERKCEFRVKQNSIRAVPLTLFIGTSTLGVFRQ